MPCKPLTQRNLQDIYDRVSRELDSAIDDNLKVSLRGGIDGSDVDSDAELVAEDSDDGFISPDFPVRENPTEFPKRDPPPFQTTKRSQKKIERKVFTF